MRLLAVIGLILTLMAGLASCGGGGRNRSSGEYCEPNTNHVQLQAVQQKGKRKSTATFWDINEDFIPHEGEFKFQGANLYYTNTIELENGTTEELRLYVQYRPKRKENEDDPDEYILLTQCLGGLSPQNLDLFLPVELEIPVVADYVVEPGGKTIMSYRTLKVDFRQRADRGWIEGRADLVGGEGFEGSLKKPYDDNDDMLVHPEKIKFVRTTRRGCSTPFETRAHVDYAGNGKSAENSGVKLQIASLFQGPDRIEEGEDREELNCDEEEEVEAAEQQQPLNAPPFEGRAL